MKKIILILFIIAFAVIVIFTIKNRKITRPEADYIGTIYHSEMLGMDAGWQYIYYIYPDENQTYLYIKSKSEITIAGASEEQDVKLEKIKSQRDLHEIENDMEMDKQTNAQQFIHYTYVNGSDIKNLNSIDELADCLFEN